MPPKNRNHSKKKTHASEVASERRSDVPVACLQKTQNDLGHNAVCGRESRSRPPSHMSKVLITNLSPKSARRCLDKVFFGQARPSPIPDCHHASHRCCFAATHMRASHGQREAHSQQFARVAPNNQDRRRSAMWKNRRLPVSPLVDAG